MNEIKEWFEKLPLDKHMFIAQHVKKKIDKIQKDTESILDSCYIAAMIELFDMNLDDCIKIAEKANENMDETLKLLNKEGEKYYMKANNNVLREEIKAEVKVLIEENRKLNNLEIIKLLDKDYDLPKKDLQILIKEAREEMANEALKELEKEINVKEVEEEIDIEVFKDGEKVDLGNIKAPVIEFEEAKKQKLKIKSIEVEGQFGYYTKSADGVRLEDKTYKNMEEVEKEKGIVYKNLDDEEIKLKKRIEDLNNQLQNVETKRQERNGIYAEIEMVFQM